MPKEVVSKSRSWCITSYHVETPPLFTSMMQYLVFQKEKGKKSGKLHWQIFVKYNNPIPFTRVQKDFGSQLKIKERYAKATDQQAADYCKKEDTRVDMWQEFGILPPGQGKRNDLATMRAMLKERKTDDEIHDATQDSFQVYSIIERQRLKFIPRRKLSDIPPVINWYWGETGVGKSKRAIEEFEDDYDDVSFSKNGFIIGYTGHKHTLVDEFRGGCDWDLLLKLLDRKHCTVNCKNYNGVNWNPSIITITSPFHPDALYQDISNESKLQLIRRITNIIEIKKVVN